MLSFKNHLLKYKSCARITSFNLNSVNSFIWNIRNSIVYIYFFIMKKCIFLSLYLKYNKICIYLFYRRNKIIGKDSLLCTSLYSKCFNIYSLLAVLIYQSYYLKVSRIYSHTYYHNLNYFFLSSTTLSRCINTLYSRYYHLLSFLFTYKYSVFSTFLLLYVLKYINYDKNSAGSIPSRVKLYTVLRSPHKDKKSREQFVMRKIKKTLSYPSFLNGRNNNPLLFSNFTNENVLLQIHNNRYII